MTTHGGRPTGPPTGAAGPTPPAVAVDGLSKRYGANTAVDGISFEVGRGEIFGFLGPNGAGKSTTIKMLATLVRPTSGTASLAGWDVVRHPVQVRRSIGLVFQDNSLDDRLTAEENLYIHALVYDVPLAEFAARAEAVLRMVDLLDRRGAVVRTFSGGMRRRLEIARGLLHTPAVLFLDEPTVGLDPQTRSAIWRHLRGLRQAAGTTVFMTTHYMDEAENCDRIAIIDRGRLIAQGTPEELKRSIGGDVLEVRAPDADALGREVAARYGLPVPPGRDGLLRLEVPDGASFLPRLAADFPGRIQSIGTRRPTLEDVFLRLTGRAIREEQASGVDRRRMARRA